MDNKKNNKQVPQYVLKAKPKRPTREDLTLRTWFIEPEKIEPLLKKDNKTEGDKQ